MSFRTKVKAWAKTFFPAPARSFHIRMDVQQNQINQMKRQIEVLQERLGKLLADLNQGKSSVVAALNQEAMKLIEKMDNQEQLLLQSLDSQSQRIAESTALIPTIHRGIADNGQLIQTVREEIREKAYLYRGDFEYQYYRPALSGGVRNIPDFENRFLRLVKGLDADSIETVVKIWKRMDVVHMTEFRPHNLFTREEQKKLWELQDRFWENSFKISESLYFYQGYFLPFNQFEPCVFYYRSGLEFLRHPEVFRNRDIIDAGAFIGDSALMFSPMTAKNVYSFEPIPQNYALMERTISLNHLTNVVPIPLALSDEKATLTFSIGGSCSNSFANATFHYSGEVEVDAVTLDDYVEEHGLDVGLIKTDLEGAEQAFLRGAIRTIRRCRPTLLLSIYHTVDDFLDIKTMLEDLELGYRFRICKPLDGSIMLETMLIAEVD